MKVKTKIWVHLCSEDLCSDRALKVLFLSGQFRSEIEIYNKIAGIVPVVWGQLARRAIKKGGKHTKFDSKMNLYNVKDQNRKTENYM